MSLLSFFNRVSFGGLISIALGLIGLAVLAIGVTIMTLRQDALRDAANDSANIATVLAEQTERSVQAIDIVTSEVAERFGLASGGVALADFAELLRSRETNTRLNERLASLPQADFVAVIDRDGRLANTSRLWPPPGSDVSNRDYFRHAQANQDRTLFVSDLVLNGISNERNVFFSKRITGPNGEFLGVVLTGIKLTYFQHIYTSITSLRNQSFMFTRKDGTILVRHPDRGDDPGLKIPDDSEWHNLVRTGGGSFRTVSDFDDVPRLISAKSLKAYPLVVNVALSERGVLASWQRRSTVIALGTGLALLCSLLLIYALYRQFAQLATSKSRLSERESRLAEKTDELEEANSRIDTAVDNMLQGLTMFNAQAELIVCNNRYRELYHLSPDICKPGTTLRQLLEARTEAGTFVGSIDDYMTELAEKVAAGEQMVKIAETADGRTFCVTNRPTRDGGWVATHEDITERQRAEKELDRARNMLRATVDNIPEMLVVKEAKSGRFVFVNRAGEAYFHLPKEDIIGKTTADVHPADRAIDIVNRDRIALQNDRITVENLTIQTAEGNQRDLVTRRIPIDGKDGDPEYLLTVIEDVTAKRQNETRIAHLAHHDPLTDLPNRAFFNTRLAEAIAEAAETDGKFAILCVDLDRFKEVNDLYGHAAGDSVLHEITKRMLAAVNGAFLARVGGDEFMALCVGDALPGGATAMARSLVGSLATDIDCDGRKVSIGMSIGIAMYPSDGIDSVTLLRNADAALYRAKAEGRGEIRFFEADMDRMLHDRRTLQAELALAVSRNELQLFFQPQSRISGEIIGFEALLRWDHLRRGFVPPDTFIPLAEESGLINQIGEWVLREACREAASWRKPLQIAINLSPVQLRQGDLVSLLQSILGESGLSPERLVIEITEGALMDDYSRAVSILRRIKALGVRIAMDDFGTGYSSLSYLQSFPFDKIKIDQTFISNLDRSKQSAAIVRAVLALGHNLNLKTVAEGVENQEQLAILRREGCDEIQGYLVGRPQPISDYAALVGRPKGQERDSYAAE